ncbi:MAG: hypothetical protein AAFY56_04300, partial [Pseudomonadota bacterium]
DVARGDAGADTFLFDPSDESGDDTILDFAFADGDSIALSAAGILRTTPDIEEFSGAALDASEDYTISSSEEDGSGDLVINHPGGSITLVGRPFSEEVSFAGLEEAGALEFQGIVEGSGTLTSTEGDNVLTGSDGSDQFVFDPSSEQGDDVITNFQVPTDGSTTNDFLAFSSEQILAASPDLAAADGDASTLNLSDFAASSDYELDESANGDFVLTHPGGTIELQGVEFTEGQYEDLRPFILVDGETVPDEGIPVEVTDDDGDTDDDEDVADDDGDTDDDDDTDDDEDVADDDGDTDDDDDDTDDDDDDTDDDEDVADDDDDTDDDEDVADDDDDTDDDEDVADDDDDTDDDEDVADDDGDTDDDEDVADDDGDTDDDEDVADDDEVGTGDQEGDEVAGGDDDTDEDEDDVSTGDGLEVSSAVDGDDDGFDFASLDSATSSSTDDGLSGFSFATDLPELGSSLGSNDVDIA